MRRLFFLLMSWVLLNTTAVHAQQNTWEQTNLTSQKIVALETTPWGILAGELNSRFFSFPMPFNGLYISRDLGNSWQELGFQQTGIKDILYKDEKIYVGTYFNFYHPAGMYISEDGGQTWAHAGKNTSANKIAVSGNTLFLGGSYEGLWVSQDYGQTWELKITDDPYQTEIIALNAEDTIAFAATLHGFYKSTDKGVTWEQDPFFEGRKTYSIEIYKNIVWVGTNRGFFRSNDCGNTWQLLNNWETSPTGAISYTNGVLTAAKMPIYWFCDIGISYDLGTTWQSTELNFMATVEECIYDTTEAFLSTNIIFAIPHENQVVRNTLMHTPEVNPIFAIPWTEQTSADLVDKIYSFFDHKYPLLGYNYYSEPEETRETTLNYLGEEEKQPEIYYSSHDGYDYTLPYGTPILAAASGYAQYDYCSACGHTIKINHLNGFQTTYMHLQKEGLIATNDFPVWVNEKKQIGLVGMTGNTTGPHLHFAVVKDKNENDTFADDIPSGRLDPYSWLPQSTDPWEIYTWEDMLGTHQGSQSPYLWKTNPTGKIIPVENTKVLAEIDNKKIELPQNALDKIGTLIFNANGSPKISDLQNFLGYVSQTAFVAQVKDFLGSKIPELNIAAKITIDISGSDLTKIIPESLKIYFWNEIIGLWEAIPTVVDLVKGIVTGETKHFSQFAVLGEKKDPNPPQTLLYTQGILENGWFAQYPTLTLETSDTDTDKIFYAIDNLWEEYKMPFELKREGIVKVSARSLDISGNIEPVKNYVIKVNTTAKFTKKVSVRNTRVTIE